MIDILEKTPELIDILLWSSVIGVGLIVLCRDRAIFAASLYEAAIDFINIVPRIALVVIGSRYMTAFDPNGQVIEWLGRGSGWSGVAIAVVVGVATPAVPLVGFFVGAVLMRSHAGGAQVIAYIVAWTLFAARRVILWEIPSLPARFIWVRCALSLPLPFLAAGIAMAIIPGK